MKFRKMTSLALMLAMAAMSTGAVYADTADSAPLTAYETVSYPVIGGNITFEKSTGAITNSDWEVVIVNIPEQIEGIDVTSIVEESHPFSVGHANTSFYARISLASLTLPKTLLSIGDRAFSGCTSLAKVDMSENLLFIGKETFDGCSQLSSITLPDTLLSMGERAFRGCTALQSVKLPANLTSTSQANFENCTSLRNIELPESITSISNYSFNNTGLTSVVIPDNCASIGTEAFARCEGLEQVTIPKATVSISDTAFKDSGLKTVKCYKNSVADNAALYPEGVVFDYFDEPKPEQIISGDVDGDGRITANDSAMVLQKALLSTFKMNVDGVFNIAKD